MSKWEDSLGLESGFDVGVFDLGGSVSVWVLRLGDGECTHSVL